MSDSTPVTSNPEQPEQQHPATEPAPTKSNRKGIIVVVLILVAAVAFWFWWRSRDYESTDDAQVSGNLIQISSRIPGQIMKVNVEENQYVTKGTVLAETDSAELLVSEENAEAALATAEANAVAARVNVPITSANTGSQISSAGSDVASAEAGVAQSQKQLEAAKAQVQQAQAGYDKAKADLERYTPLVQKDVISKQQYDAAVAQADGQKAALEAAKANQQAAGEGIKVATQRVNQATASLRAANTGPQQVAAQNARAKAADAQVKQAQAQLDEAKLNLSYTKIVAPVDGIVMHKSVEMLENVSAGQNLMTLVDIGDLWVTANYKETQLRDMRAGQPVEMEVDATGRTYHGKVTQIGGATGSITSLFPAENATGNYVKVVQRVPVRIDFTDKSEDKDHLLRPGLSVDPKVKVR